MDNQSEYTDIKMQFVAMKVNWERNVKTFPFDGQRGCKQHKVDALAIINDYRAMLREMQDKNPEIFSLLQDVLDAIAAPNFNYLNLGRDEFITRINRVLEQTEQVIGQKFGELE